MIQRLRRLLSPAFRAVPELRRRLGLEECIVLLTVARMAIGRSKGHDRVLDAFTRMENRGAHYKYLVVGDGPDKARIEARAASLGLNDRVVFFGAAADQELPDIYNSCDIFILVSTFQIIGTPQGEGVPLVVLEAQACGKPAITSSRDGSAESIDDGHTGILVDPAEPESLVAAIQELTAPDLRLRMGQAARKRSIEQCSFGIYSEALAATVQEVMTHN